MMKWLCLFAAFLATPLWGVTIHRSFRTREAGIGFGTGTASVVYPVDARIDKAIGFDFFSKLPLAEQAALEAKSDFNEWDR